MNFVICSFKITCKPMGNSTENLNLGKSLLPPPPLKQFKVHIAGKRKEKKKETEKEKKHFHFFFFFFTCTFHIWMSECFNTFCKINRSGSSLFLFSM